MNDAEVAPTGITSTMFRETMGHYPTGVVAVTGVTSSGEATAMVVGSFVSVSLDPPLIAFLPTKESSTFAELRTAKTLCINVLAADQEQLCRSLARRGTAKLADVDWVESQYGAPVLPGVVATVDCAIAEVLEGGDHYIILCNVLDMNIVQPDAPLVFFQGGYGRFSVNSLVTRDDTGMILSARLGEAARASLEEMARLANAECTLFARIGEDVVAVASASAPGVTSAMTLGTRFPLMPPLGELFASFGEEELADRWIQRAPRREDSGQDASQLKARLQQVREQGWAATLASDTGEDTLVEAMREYSAHDLTPSRLKEVTRKLNEATDRRQTVAELQADQRYSLGTIAFPVLSADGNAALVLRLSQITPAQTGETINRWIDQLRTLASHLQDLRSEDGEPLH